MLTGSAKLPASIVRIQSQTSDAVTVSVRIDGETSDRTLTIDGRSDFVLDLSRIETQDVTAPALAIITDGPSVALLPVPRVYSPALPVWCLLFVTLWLAIRLF